MRYGLIGEHLGHSFSPEIHGLLGNEDYQLKELNPSDLESFFKSRDFDGVNVTIPYKKSVLPFLDVIDDVVQVIGAVNTVVRKDGLLYGYNTDYFGLTELIRHSGIEIDGRNVLVLGAGGAGSVAVAVANEMGAAMVSTAVRSPQNGQLLLSAASAVPEYSDFQIIINATPVGMHPDNTSSPVDIKAFPELEGVVDCVYNPLRTQLVLDAQEAGIKAEGGLYMLVAQACKAHDLFFGKLSDASVIDSVYDNILKRYQNIVLCGMPSCGKSTLGRRLADEDGKPFVDTDSLIVERTGRSIPDIFKDDGESYFRAIESEIISELSTMRGVVIALGGGAVLTRENVYNVKRNGRLLFINKPLDALTASPDRPLSMTPEALSKLYAERLPIYLSVADEMG